MSLVTEARRELVVWWVGQGLLVTLSEQDVCTHIDAGGEYFPKESLTRLCQNKRARLFLSHWDWDHISFSNKLRATSAELCLAAKPIGPSSPRKMNFIKKLPDCTTNSYLDKKIAMNIWTWTPMQSSKSRANDLSRVVATEGFLLPGDSPISKEKIWAKQLPDPEKLHTLIAGHHGSQTSSSNELLGRLKNTNQVIISARKKRFGHPHPSAVRRLRAHKMAVLRTEDWGNLRFQLAPHFSLNVNNP